MAEYVPLERLKREVSGALSMDTDALKMQLTELQTWQDHELASERAKAELRLLIGHVGFELSVRSDGAITENALEYADSHA